MGPLILSKERKKYNRDNFYKLLRLKNFVFTLSKATHLGGAISEHYIIYTHETKYLEMGGKSFSKLTIADICYGVRYGCEGEMVLARGFAHGRARENDFFLLILV